MKYVCVKLFIIYIGENSVNNSILRQTQNFSNQSLCDLRLSPHIYIAIDMSVRLCIIAPQYPFYAWVTRIYLNFSTNFVLYRTLLCVSRGKINSSTRARTCCVLGLCVVFFLFACVKNFVITNYMIFSSFQGETCNLPTCFGIQSIQCKKTK